MLPYARMRAPTLAASLAVALAVALPHPAEACAPAPPPGVTVQIADEAAIIVWNAAAHHEDFIRRASFRTAGKDFGFLVPTPDKPELAEVPDEVFDRLESATRSEVIHQTQVGGVELTSFCLGYFMLRSKSEATAPAPVRVIDTQRVAGYDAVVLEADSAGALVAWLKEHGYAERAELSAWLAPYVAAKWKITAFKIAATGATQAVDTTAVRMSFTTERPFFPYREPSDQRETSQASHADRLLRVFFFGAGRVEGTIGGAAGSRWPGRTIWSNHFDAVHAGSLPFTIPEGAWLTLFEDRASPRPGIDDLFFSPASDRAPVKPPPIVIVQQQKMPLPIDMMLGSLLVAAFILRKLRRYFRRK